MTNRARNIKPGVFQNEDLGEIDDTGVLLFIGLWTLTDRRGVLEDRPKQIRKEIFGYKDHTVERVIGLLDDLEKHEFIKRYRHDDKNYIFVVNFSKHQKPHYKEKSLRNVPLPQGYTLYDSDENPNPTLVEPPLNMEYGILKEEYCILESGIIEIYPELEKRISILVHTWKQAFPGVDLVAETKKARSWELSSPKRKKKLHSPFLNNWFSTAFGNLKPRSQGSTMPEIM